MIKLLLLISETEKRTTVRLLLKNVAGNTSVVTAGMGGEVVFGARLESLELR